MCSRERGGLTLEEVWLWMLDEEEEKSCIGWCDEG